MRVYGADIKSPPRANCAGPKCVLASAYKQCSTFGGDLQHWSYCIRHCTSRAERSCACLLQCPVFTERRGYCMSITLGDQSTCSLLAATHRAQSVLRRGCSRLLC